MKRALANCLRPGSFVRNVGQLIAAQAIVLITAPLLTRLFTLEAFGELGIFTCVVGVLQFLCMLGYYRAIPVPRRELDALGVFVLALLGLTVSCTLLLIVVELWAEPLFGWLGAPWMMRHVWIVPAAVFIGGLHETLSSWAIRQNDINTLTRTRLWQGLGTFLAQFSAGLAHLGSPGLLGGEIIGRSLGIGTLFRMIWKSQSHALASLSSYRLLLLARRYWQFPIFQMPSSLITQLAVVTPALFIASCYGPTAAGIFIMAEKVIQAPLVIIGRSVARVYLAEAAEIGRKAPWRLRMVMNRTFCQLMCVGAVPTGIVLLAGPWLFAVVLGETWRESGQVAQILALPLLLQFAISPLTQTLVITERQSQVLAWSMLRLGLNALAIYGSVAAGWSIDTAVLNYAAVTTLAYGGIWGMLLVAIRQTSAPADSASDIATDSTLLLPAPDIARTDDAPRLKLRPAG